MGSQEIEIKAKLERLPNHSNKQIYVHINICLPKVVKRYVIGSSESACMAYSDISLKAHDYGGVD